MLVKHKFLDKYPMAGKKIVIIGTFNPDVEENKAEFFYGRSRNYFWNLLPKVFGYEPLKEKDIKKHLVTILLHHQKNTIFTIPTLKWESVFTIK